MFRFYYERCMRGRGSNEIFPTVQSLWDLAGTLRPIRAVQAAVLDRLRDMLGLKVWSIVQIGDRSGYFQDAVVGSRAQALLGHGAFEEAFAVGGKFAVGADVAGGHLSVAIEFFA